MTYPYMVEGKLTSAEYHVQICATPGWLTWTTADNLSAATSILNDALSLSSHPPRDLGRDP